MELIATVIAALLAAVLVGVRTQKPQPAKVPARHEPRR